MPSTCSDDSSRFALIAELLTQLPSAVAYLAGPEHTFEFANDAYRRLVGGRDVVGRSVRDALPEVAGQGYFEMLDRVLATGERAGGREAEVWVRRHGESPEQVFLDFVYQPVRDDSGAAVGILVHAADVTSHVHDRRGLEVLTAELADAEERHRTLFETMLHGVVYHDADGAIIAANPTAAQILGVDAEHLVGLSPRDSRWSAVRSDGSLLPAEEHPAMVALRTGQVVADVEMGVTHGRSRERRWLSVTAVPDARDARGRPQRAYAMFRDLTEQRRTAVALRERDSFLGRLRDANVLGIVVADEGRVLDANDAFLRMVGHDRSDLLAGRIDWRAMTPPEWAHRDDDALDQLRRSGACRPFEKELVHASGHRVPILIGAAVTDRNPLRWVTFVADLSERERAERERAELLANARAARTEAEIAKERLGFLLRAGALAAATHDRDEMLQHATRLVVPALADFAAVFLPSQDGALIASAVEHHDPAGAAVLAALRRQPVSATCGVGLQGAFATGRTQLVRDVAARLRKCASNDRELVEVAGQLSVDSVVAIPLTVAGRTVAVLGLGRSCGRPPFSDLDVAVVEELGRRLAVGLTNADASARDHSVAEILQRSVLPDALPAVPGVDLAVRYLPATDGVDVGGDWYDAFPLGGGRLGLVVGDVVGHSLASASIMAQARNAVRAYAVDTPDPAAVLERTNIALSRLLPEAMATVVYAVLDPGSGEITYANAGHPPPLLTCPDSEPEYLTEALGVMLGVDDGTAFTSAKRHLAPGCGLLLYSDGLIEDRRRSIGEGLADLAAVFSGRGPLPAEDMCARAQSTLLGSPGRADDVCLLAVRLPA